ncbi:hypothetical protein [Pandoraea sputorum]|uniref:hypothetical protein n=1 Tax=Pandoraea sputorum TaxID=93222 RepID=UPI00124271FC|nr:hypothetical protein [Pandoraea sputorum]
MSNTLGHMGQAMTIITRVTRFLRGVPARETGAQALGRMWAMDPDAVNPYARGTVEHDEWAASRENRQKLLAFVLLW